MGFTAGWSMFDSLTEKIQKVFKDLRGHGKLSEENIREALGQVRAALLEADVHLETVGRFLEGVREKALGRDVLLSVTPGQTLIRVVHEELISLLTPKDRKAVRLRFAPAPPTLILMAGLQGTGKTTTAAKIARFLKADGRRPGLVAADLQRPAAVEQLATLSSQVGVPFFGPESGEKPQDVCQRAVRSALARECDILILDTAGRLHVDEALMDEIASIQRLVKPHNILLTCDAMAGQDAVRSAGAFHARLPLTGIVLTKADGDARGGAVLSMTAVTGVPVQFVGVSEKMDGLEPFHPDRMASRILGMGDILTLVEKAEKAAQETVRRREEAKGGGFDLDAMLEQLRQVRKMGPMEDLLGMIPGGDRLKGRLPQSGPDESKMSRMEAILLSMTPKERRHPQLLDGSRKKRIAAGSGTRADEVNNLLKQYEMMRKLMKNQGMLAKMQRMMGGGNPGGLPPGFPGPGRS
jgi:signal recognition particle subunit SRP54